MTATTLQLSADAKAELKRILALPENQGQKLTLFVRSIGCGVPNLGIALEQSVDSLVPLLSDDVTLFVAPKVMEYVQAEGGISITCRPRSYGPAEFDIRISNGEGDCQ